MQRMTLPDSGRFLIHTSIRSRWILLSALSKFARPLQIRGIYHGLSQNLDLQMLLQL